MICAAGPGHGDEVVAGKELGAADDDEDEAEREGQAAERPGRAEAERRAGDHQRVGHGAERDESAGENAERDESQYRHLRLGDRCRLDARGDLRRRVGLDV